MISMEWFVIILYCLALLFIFIFSLGQLNLAWHYLKTKNKESNKTVNLAEYPMVTVQLPIYNEKYVVDRLIDAVSNFDYPKDKLEIQLLDDSTDETVEIIAEKVVTMVSKGVDIRHVRRGDRKGFKAGALQYGMEQCKVEFIAIFDASFFLIQIF